MNNKLIIMFLGSLIVFPVVLICLVLAVMAVLSFLAWDWYFFLNLTDYLTMFRFCCIIGWAASIINLSE